MSSPKNSIIQTPGQKQQMNMAVVPAEHLINTIKAQEAKLVKMIEYCQVADGEITRLQQRAHKATQIAAKYAAKAKKIETDLTRAIQQERGILLAAHRYDVELLKQVIASLLDNEVCSMVPRPKTYQSFIPRPFNTFLADHVLVISVQKDEIGLTLHYAQPKEETHANDTSATNDLTANTDSDLP